MKDNVKSLRLCSLLPSATEIIFGLGLGDHLVAVTHECDYPAEALTKPKVTRSVISPALSSIEIDFRVRQQLEDVGSLYHLDVEFLDTLEPDIILTQQLCTVCAVSYENVSRIARRLKSHPNVINLEPNSLEGIFQSIREVGELTGVRTRADTLVEELRERVKRIQKLTNNVGRRNVLCLEWLEPPFCSGHWIPELVEIAGGVDELSQKHKPSRQVDWNQIVSYNPEVLVVACCGFSVERTLQEISVLNRPEIQKCSAVKNGEVYIVDGSSYFSRPGPRIVDSVEILATILHPELFPFDYPPSVVQRWRDEKVYSFT